MDSLPPLLCTLIEQFVVVAYCCRIASLLHTTLNKGISFENKVMQSKGLRTYCITKKVGQTAAEAPVKLKIKHTKLHVEGEMCWRESQTA